MNLFNAENLRKARLLKRITQAELAEKVGMSSASICRIERGERLPTASQIEAFSQALDSMTMKEVTIPERDISVATRLAGLQHRIKVEISLEQILSDVVGRTDEKFLNLQPQNQEQSKALVFYVPLDGLEVEVDSFETDQEEESTTQTTTHMRPRQI
jgi:transcriptional regulator with XRE-family HTH domain